MADQNESSVLFSLKELMNLEQDRIAQEEATVAQKKRDADDAQAAAQLAAEQAEAKRIQDAADAIEAEARKGREEETRLEAIRQAELDKAKAETEHRAQLENMAAQRQHEAQLAQIKGQSSAKRTKIFGGIAIALLVFAIGGLGYKSYQDQQVARAERIALEKRMAEENRKHAEALTLLQKESQDIALKLSEAKSEAERDRLGRLQAQNAAKAKALQEQKAAASAPQVSPKRRKSSVKKSKKKKRAPEPACNCDPSDPMCSCL